MATISLKLETRKTSMRKDGTFPIKLYIEHRGDHPAINLKTYAKPNHWNESKAKLTCSWGAAYMVRNRYLQKRLRIAQDALQEYSSKLNDWTPIQLRDFVRQYIEEELAENKKHEAFAPVETVQLFEWLDKVKDNYVTITPEAKREHIHKDLLRTKKAWAQRAKTENLINCLKAGVWMPVAEDIKLSEITVSWLELLVRSLTEKGMASTTIQSKLRHLRASINYIFLLYQDETGHQLNRERNYAFGMADDGKFEIPAAQARKKRAIQYETLVKILANPVPRASHLYEQRLFALAMFNLNGMDFVDLAHLTMENLEGSYDENGCFVIEAITYKRKKCNSTNRKKAAAEIYCPVNKTAATILNQFIKDRDVTGDELIFPIFKPGTDLESKYAYKRVRNRLEIFNEALRELAALAGYAGIELTSKVLRHTYATSLKRKGESIYTIQELLGHASYAQTEEYLAGVELYELERASQLVGIEVNLDAEPPAAPEPTIVKLRPAS